MAVAEERKSVPLPRRSALATRSKAVAVAWLKRAAGTFAVFAAGLLLVALPYTGRPVSCGVFRGGHTLVVRPARVEHLRLYGVHRLGVRARPASRVGRRRSRHSS